MDSHQPRAWRRLSVAIIGGGIGGMSAAISLRRAGHAVTIYERNDFAGEVGASVSCAANGTRWLHEWGVDIQRGDPVVLRKLINRDWRTGEPEQGMGSRAKLCVNYKCEAIDHETGIIKFANGHTAQHDLIVGADGIGSAVRKIICLNSKKQPSESSCLHANVHTKDVGGQEGKWAKIVLSPCNGGKLLSYYCFFPRAMSDYVSHTWGNEDRPVEELLAPYPELDEQVKKHLAIGTENQPWRLWVHEPYPYIVRNNICLLGDAGHPMMPHQSQGACMAIEDSAALGILFSPAYFTGDIKESLSIYEQLRLPRATRIQAAAAKAAYNINERIGFSSDTDIPGYRVEDEKEKLTIEEMNAYDMYKDIDEKFARRNCVPFTENFVKGLPIGVRLSNGVVIEKAS